MDKKGVTPSDLIFQGSSRCPLPPASILSRTAATGCRPVVGATAVSLSPGCRSTLFSCQRTDTAVCQNHVRAPLGGDFITDYTKLRFLQLSPRRLLRSKLRNRLHDDRKKHALIRSS